MSLHMAKEFCRYDKVKDLGLGKINYPDGLNVIARVLESWALFLALVRGEK